MSESWKLYEPFLISLILGGLIGIEREYNKQKEGTPSFGGIRTFILISLLGTLSAQINANYQWFLHLGFISTLLLLTIAQIVKRSPHLTSSFCALLTFTIGVLCGNGKYLLATAISVVVLFVLSFKEQMHELAKSLTIEDFYALLKFATVTVIIYPILPDKNFYGVNPKEVWTMVAVISTIDFVGYTLTKFVGKKGILITGLIGGLVSSTAVTVTFSSLSRISPDLIREYGGGIVGASAIMFMRMVFLSAIVNKEFATSLLIPCLPAFLVGTFFAYKLSSATAKETQIKVKNPYELSTAIKFGLFYALILFLSKNGVKVLGDLGLYVVSAVSGLSDVDAITLSTAKLYSSETITLIAAVTAVLIAATVNTLFKWFLTFYMGSKELFKRVSLGFFALILGEIVGILGLLLLK